MKGGDWSNNIIVVRHGQSHTKDISEYLEAILFIAKREGLLLVSNWQKAEHRAEY